jgi:tetratricopeptide (TPR) repeat protein
LGRLLLLGWVLLAPACGSASERHRARAAELRHEGNVGAAIAELDQAIAADPTNAYAYNDRAVARRAAGDMRGAMADFARGIECDPQYGTLYVNRARARLDALTLQSSAAEVAKADTAAALADCDRAVGLPRYEQAARQERILIFFLTADMARAEKEIVAYLGLHPPDARVWQGLLHVVRREDAAAQAVFEEILRENPAARAATEADIRAIRLKRDGG